MKSKIAIILLITGLLSIGAWNGYGQTSKSTTVKYEYAVIEDPTIRLSHDEGLKKLNELGAHGWEIVGVTVVPNSYPRLYLKRAIK